MPPPRQAKRDRVTDSRRKDVGFQAAQSPSGQIANGLRSERGLRHKDVGKDLRAQRVSAREQQHCRTRSKKKTSPRAVNLPTDAGTCGNEPKTS